LDFAICGNELKGRHSGGQAAILHAGPVGTGSDRASYGNMGQRGEIMQRKPLTIKPGTQLPIIDSRPYRYGMRQAIHLHLVNLFERDKVVGTVSNAVEAVACPATF